MRVCIVGGIFGKPASYRAKHSISPETVLADGLSARGVQVSVQGHGEAAPRGFDVVHVHHFGRGALKAAACKSREQRFVFTMHDPFLMNGLPVPWKRRLTDRVVLHAADRLVALSRLERDFMVSQYRLPVERTAVIPNGFDSSLYSPSEWSARETATLLFVGQLREFKGLDYLFPAFAQVARRRPDARLVLAYQVARELNRYLALAERCGVAGQVEFAGAKNAQELSELYRKAAMVVVPSLGECLSSVVIEAMLCGAPVVATSVGGIRDQVDETNGLIVPPRNSEALGRAILSLLDDPAARARMGEAARSKAVSKFSVPAMIEGHLRLYESALSAAPAGQELSRRVVGFGVRRALEFLS